MHTCFRHALARRCVRPFSVTGCLFNLYKTLGVDKGASPEQIREAYKKKAKLLHPDVNKSKDAHKEFAKLGEAHEILSDADKRRNYDLTGMANPQEAQQAAQAAAQQAAFRNAFGGAFGGAARAYEPPRKPSPVKPKPTRGRDVTAKVVLGLQVRRSPACAVVPRRCRVCCVGRRSSVVCACDDPLPTVWGGGGQTLKISLCT